MSVYVDKLHFFQPGYAVGINQYMISFRLTDMPSGQVLGTPAPGETSTSGMQSTMGVKVSCSINVMLKMFNTIVFNVNCIHNPTF